MSTVVAGPAFGRAPVLAAWDETPALRAVQIALPPDLATRHQIPGQVLKVRDPRGGEGYLALATAPADHGRVELLLKRGAPLNDALIAAAHVGGEIEISEPHGRGFPVEASHGRDVLLFATGSGISPIRALIQHILSVRTRVGRTVLFYGQRHDNDFAYRREIPSWEAGNIRVFLCCSQPSLAWTDARGYVQDVALACAFGAVTATHAVAYLCGVKPMVLAVRQSLAAAGVPGERTFLNY